MTTVTPVTLEELFAIKIATGKDADAAKAAESMFEMYHAGWVGAADKGGVNLGSSQEGRGKIAVELKKCIPIYNSHPIASKAIFAEIIRAWIVTNSLEDEVIFADEILFSRFHGLRELMSKELSGMGSTVLVKVYRILSRLSKEEIAHNSSVLWAMVELLRAAPVEHLITIGKIMSTGAIDAHFVDFRLPKLVRALESVSKK